MRWTRSHNSIASAVYEASNATHNFAIMATPLSESHRGPFYLAVEDKNGNLISRWAGKSVSELKALVATKEG